MASLYYGAKDNLFSIAKTKGIDGSLLDLTCTMCEANAMLQDLATKPANGGRVHQGVRTAKLPSGQIVTVGGYWGSDKSEYQNFTEGMFLMKSSYECAVDVLDREGANKAGFLNQEDQNFTEGMSQGHANLLIQGNTTPNEASIVGLNKRTPYAGIDEEFCLDCKGTGANLRSAWLVAANPNLVHFIYDPTHPTMGIERKVMPLWREVNPTDSTQHRWMMTIEYAFEQGICIRDYKAVKRLANIAAGPSDAPSTDFLNKLIQARHQHTTIGDQKNVTFGGGTQRFLYLDPMTYIKLVQGANANIKVLVSDRNIYRVNLPMIDDIILRKMDALNMPLNSGETQVT